MWWCTDTSSGADMQAVHARGRVMRQGPAAPAQVWREKHPLC